MTHFKKVIDNANCSRWEFIPVTNTQKSSFMLDDIFHVILYKNILSISISQNHLVLLIMNKIPTRI